MSELKLKGKEIRAIGYPEGPVISIAMGTVGKFIPKIVRMDGTRPGKTPVTER